jgi:hypothetical protein
MISKIIKFGENVYDIFIRNFYLYYYPIDTVCVLNNHDTNIEHFNHLKKYPNNKYEFIYKYNKIENIEGKIYNQGHVYHTNNNKINKIVIKQIFPPDDIQSIKIILFNEKQYELEIFDDIKNKTNFISDILSHVTNESNLRSLLYYYLQLYRNIRDKIIKVELKIDDNYIEIESNNTINKIYQQVNERLSLL